MRRALILSTVLFVAVVVVAVLAIAGRPSTAHGDITAADVVTTTGHGTVTATPDQATVTAGVHTQAVTAADALSQNAKLANAVVAALKGAGGTDLQTQQVSLYPQTDNDGKVTGYAADDSISASSPVAGAGALIDAAVGAGANSVSGPTLGLSQQDDLYKQALAEAVKDARDKAEALGTAGNFVVGPVSTVTEDSQDSAPVPFAAATKAADSATPVEPGTQDVTADVTVTFAIR
jgi:uncharacterized protein YggE